MPPKKPNLCGSRNKVLFTKFIGKTRLKINSLVARALSDDGDLAQFKDQVHASECAFSYPGSEWFSVFLLKPDGKKYYNQDSGEVEKLYFKLILNPEGDDGSIGERTTTMPPELAGIQNCIITASGACGNPPGYKSRGDGASGSQSQSQSQSQSESPAKSAKSAKSDKKKPTTNTGSSSSVPVALPSMESPESRQETLERVKTVSVGGIPGEAGTGNLSKAKIERSYFENLGSKELIIDWMIKNMKHADIIGCIKRGSLSPAMVSQAEALGGGMASSAGPAGSSGDISAAEMQLVQQAMASMTTGDVKKTFKEISKNELVGFINSISDPIKKAQKIVQLCNYAGFPNFTIKQVPGRAGKQIVKIMDGEAELQPEEFNDVINECSEKEATRVSLILRKKAAAKTVIDETKRRSRGKGVAEGNVPSSPKGTKMTIDQIIGSIRNNPNKNEKNSEIVALCHQVGLKQFVAQSTLGRAGKIIVKILENGAELDDDEINEVLTQCGTAKLNAFGKKRKSSSSKAVVNFRKAAKICKGGSKYRSCMKRTLRNMYK